MAQGFYTLLSDNTFSRIWRIIIDNKHFIRIRRIIYGKSNPEKVNLTGLTLFENIPVFKYDENVAKKPHFSLFWTRQRAIVKTIARYQLSTFMGRK